MKKSLLIIIFVFIIMFFACTSKSDEKDDSVVSESKEKEITLDVAITPGTYWQHQFTYQTPMGDTALNLYPQVAIWITDENDQYLQTIYVTSTFGKQIELFNTIGGVKPTKNFGEYYLPCFASYYHDQANNPLPIYKDSMLDAVSSATPPRTYKDESEIWNGGPVDMALFNPGYIFDSSKIIIKTEKVKTTSKKINVYVELSKMTDNVQEKKYDGSKLPYFLTNKYELRDEFLDPNNPVTQKYFNFGEPSLIYKVEIKVNKNGEYDLKLIGHGGLLSGVINNSEFKPDEGLGLHDDADALERIYKNQADTGLKIAQNIKVIVK